AVRALLVALLGWLPLAIFALTEGLGSGAPGHSFFTDFAVYARSLIAAPLLILAERDCLPRLGAVAGHFIGAGLVPESERRRYADAVSSSRRLLDSQSVEFLVVILAYFITIAMLRFSSPADKPQWLVANGEQLGQLSLAEWWYAFVSRPVFI